MAGRASTRRGFRSRAPGRTDWTRTVSVGQVTVAASTTVLLTTFGLANAGIAETVRRTRGVIWIQSDQSAAIENQFGAFGMVVVSDPALAAGVTSMPGPVTERSDDGWFVWQPFVQSGDLSAGRTGYHYEFDSKAMRRIEQGFVIAVLAENSSASNGLQIAVGISILASRQ